MPPINTIEQFEALLQLIKEQRLVEISASNVELKSSWQQDNGKKISMLANRNIEYISWLIIGIDDSGALLNKTERWTKETEEIISQHLNQYLDPIQCIKELRPVKIEDNNWIIILSIVNPGSVVRWNNKAYKGAGTTQTEMNPDEIMGLTIRLPGTVDFTAQPSQCEINTDLVEHFTSMILKKHGDTFLLTQGLDEHEILRRLGIFQKNVTRLLFGNTKYRIVILDSSNQPIYNECYPNLYTLIPDNFLDTIKQLIKRYLALDFNISIKAFKEGLANAVAHAAYYEHEGDIILEFYPNKLIINNLCLPESVYFANKWFSRSHKTLNILLMETLRLCGAVDELGRGKNLIFTESIRNGNKPPEVVIERAGRYNRWRLILYTESIDQKSIMLLERLRTMYDNEQKVLIANALVSWSKMPVTEIKKFIDGESFPYFLDIINDFRGPVFYYEKEDRFILRRWAKIILEEGKSSKSLDYAEEESKVQFAYSFCTEYRGGFITSSDFRELTYMGDSPSEISLSSSILHRWVEKGILTKIKKGTYKFNRIEGQHTEAEKNEILRRKLLGD